MKITTLKAITYHLEKGYDNGKISREALASFLRSLVPILEEKKQKKARLKDIYDRIEEGLNKMKDDCDCENAYMESDTGAWIHDEENCRSVVYERLEESLEIITILLA